MPLAYAGMFVFSRNALSCGCAFDHFTLVPLIRSGRSAFSMMRNAASTSSRCGDSSGGVVLIGGYTALSTSAEFISTSMGSSRNAGPGIPGNCVTNGLLDVFRNAFGVVARRRILGNGLHEADVVHLLERAASKIDEGTLPADAENGGVRAPRVCHTRYGIRHPGPRRHHRHADLAGIQPRPRVRRVGRRLLVAHVDDADALVQAAVVDGHDVPAAQRENALHARILQRTRNEFTAVRHDGFPLLPICKARFAFFAKIHLGFRSARRHCIGMSFDAQQKGTLAAALRATVVAVSVMLLTAAALADSPRPNVLLVTIDTCRADRIGCYGYGIARTPTIDAVAAEGVRCADAVTTAPITMPAHTSIMTGLLPPAHGVRDNGAYALNDKAVTLAERLHDAGYDTAAFVSALVLNRRYNLNQGFDVYDDDLWAEDDPKLFMIRDRPAPKTAERAVQWLESWHEKADGKPFFLWVHFFDPHQPYESHAKNRHLIPTAYDAEIAQADEGLARIMDAFKTLGVDQNTFTVLTADHGESLGEHGEKTHAIFIYDATVHVPLIFHWPGHLPSDTVYWGPVRCIDLMPTILGALDVPGADKTQGADLLSALRGDVPPPDLPQYSESLLSELGFGMAPLYGLRFDGYKWIRAPKPELYNLRTDPQELNNLYNEKPELAAQLDAKLSALLDESKQVALETERNPMDHETLEMLQALGYLADPDDRSAVQGMDPKDGIGLYTKLEEARNEAQRGNYAECERVLRELLNIAPRHVSARNVLALAVLREGSLEGAEKEYRASLRIDPNQSRVLYMLGYIKLREGNYDEAETYYHRALAITPKFAEAMVHLGFIAVQRHREDEAKQWYDQALAVDPSFPRAHLAYADLYFIEGDYAQALIYYQRVLKTTPNHFAALLQSGLCAQRTGDPETAAKYFEEAQRLRPDSWKPPYDLACLKAVAGDADAALCLLESALTMESVDKTLVQALQSDPDFASLRDRTEFKALVNRAETEVAKSTS